MGLKRNTTHNLLKTLCLCGYATNEGKGQYIYGAGIVEMLRRMTAARPLSTRLAECIGQLAGELNETVVLTTLAGGRRLVLMRSSGTRTVQVSSSAMEREAGMLWETPTGRVMAAWCGPAERRRLIEDEGLPGERWDGIVTQAELQQALAVVRRAGTAEQHARDVASLAVPVLAAENVLLGAVGMHMPEYRWNAQAREKSLSALRAAAPRLAGIWGESLNVKAGE
jgi:DNA-binding IclR family transcriptional regulator